MPSLRERIPQPLPRHGQFERLATAQRFIQPVHVAPGPAEPQRAANDQSTSDADPAWPSDDAASLGCARSALSAPENFIAESPIKTLFARHFGRRRWPVVLVGVVITGAAAAYIGRDVPALVPRSAIVAKDTARGSADLSARPDIPSIGVPNGEAHTADAASAPQPHRDPAAEAAVPTGGANFQRRLATAGLPSSDGNAIGTTDAGVTAFPPNPEIEPEPPPTEPLAAEKEAAAVEASPARALPPQPEAKLDALVARAEQLLTAGEVAKARQFFGRIAADGDPRGAWGMARSYDEQVLRILPVGRLAANPAQAKWWSEKAQGLEAAEQPERGGRTNAAR